MAEPILFADIEATVIDGLEAALVGTAYAGTLVTSTVPNPRPARFVRVERLGGTRRSPIIDQALVTVEAWGSSQADAHDLAALCRALVNAFAWSTVGTTRIYDIAEIAGPGNLPDPESLQHRYVWQAQIATRGVALA